MQNHSNENNFDLHENETICRTHFHMNGFALRLVLKQSHKRTRKWPIAINIEAIIIENKQTKQNKQMAHGRLCHDVQKYFFQFFANGKDL